MELPYTYLINVINMARLGDGRYWQILNNITAHATVIALASTSETVRESHIIIPINYTISIICTDHTVILFGTFPHSPLKLIPGYTTAPMTALKVTAELSEALKSYIYLLGGCALGHTMEVMRRGYIIDKPTLILLSVLEKPSCHAIH